MLLFPSKTKFKKYHKSKNRFYGLDSKYLYPRVGVFGLKFLQSCRITMQQIESVRQTIKKYIREKSNEHVVISIFPDLPVTRKSSGLRMGKGKGNIEFWSVPVLKGRIAFELGSRLNKVHAFKALKSGGRKLPVLFKCVSNV